MWPPLPQSTGSRHRELVVLRETKSKKMKQHLSRRFLFGVQVCQAHFGAGGPLAGGGLAVHVLAQGGGRRWPSGP